MEIWEEFNSHFANVGKKLSENIISCTKKIK